MAVLSRPYILVSSYYKINSKIVQQSGKLFIAGCKLVRLVLTYVGKTFVFGTLPENLRKLLLCSVKIYKIKSKVLLLALNMPFFKISVNC